MCLSASYGAGPLLGCASPLPPSDPVPMALESHTPPSVFTTARAVAGSAGALPPSGAMRESYGAGVGALQSASSIPATSLLSSSCGQILVRQGSEPQQPGAPPPPPPPPPPPAASSSQLLAVSAGTPPTMLRGVWSLEDYTLHRRLYKGSMASVYKGRCLRSGMPVALKVYFKNRVPANVIHMVLREVNIHLQASEHRNVATLYGVFQTDELLVLVLELATRGSLAGVCQNLEGGRLSEVELRHAVMEPLLSALAFLHARGVCHRDIKPENLLFTADWTLRLADFGVAINLAEERAVTRAGTADYMAPEVERCPLKANPMDNKDNLSLAYTTAADVWSVGVLAYEMLMGFPPVLGRSTASAQGHAASPALSFPAFVSPAARNFITSALARRPEERPTVQQLRAHPWMAGTSVAAGTAARQMDVGPADAVCKCGSSG